MNSPTSANAYNALLGFLVVLVSLVGFPSPAKTVISLILGFLIVIFALASSNFGQHGPSGSEKI